MSPATETDYTESLQKDIIALANTSGGTVYFGISDDGSIAGVTGSLLKQVDGAYAFLDMRNETSATFEGVHRIDHRAYPTAALREALVKY